MHANKNNRTKQRLRRGKKGGNKRSLTLGTVDLPHINQKPIQTRCLRYQDYNLVSGTVYTFTVTDLRGLIGAVTNATSAYIPLIDSFRVRRIGYSALIGGTGGNASVTFAWEGPNVPDISDTSFVGISVPVTRSYYPPPNSSAVWWYDNGATSVDLFSLRYDSAGETVGMFLDIDFEYILQDGASTPLTLSANATFTGIAYLGIPQASHVFTPVALNTVHL